MYEAGKAAHIFSELRNYIKNHISVETMRGKLTTIQVVPYSGNKEENAPRTEGAASGMLSRVAQQAFVSWEAAGARIICATFRTKKIKLNTIQCHAPANDKDAEAK